MKKKRINKFDKPHKHLINPLSDDYIKSPDYFYFNSKKLSYKSLNIESTLKSLNALNIDSPPFIPKETSKPFEKNDNKDIFPKILAEPVVVKEQKKLANLIEEERTKKEEQMVSPDEINSHDIDKKIAIKLKDLNFSDIKEFYPKNFKIFKILPKIK